MFLLSKLIRPMMVAAFLVPWTFCAMAGEGAHGEPSKPFSDFDEREALAYSQAALGRTVSDFVFTDSMSRKISLADYRGRPLVISLVFTSCFHVCPLITENIAAVVDDGWKVLGRDSFSVVTVGFDTAHDTPAALGEFGRRHGVVGPGWRLLSTDKKTMAALAEELGFIFFPSPTGFDHLAQTTILDGKGKVYRQVYGADIGPQALIEPLKFLVFGRDEPTDSIAALSDKVRLFCTVYNPTLGRYEFDYSIFIGVFIGACSLLGMAIVMVRIWRQSGRRNRSGGSLS